PHSMSQQVNSTCGNNTLYSKRRFELRHGVSCIANEVVSGKQDRKSQRQLRWVEGPAKSFCCSKMSSVSESKPRMKLPHTHSPLLWMKRILCSESCRRF